MAKALLKRLRPAAAGAGAKHRSRRAIAIAGLSLADDVAIAALAQARVTAGRALLLGPKGMALGCVLGLATGAAWCALDGARRRRRRERR